MKKRILSIALTTTMIAGLLTGCGCTREEAKVSLKLDVIKKADEVIEDVVTSEEFKEADEKKRLEIAKDTVEQLPEIRSWKVIWQIMKLQRYIHSTEEHMRYFQSCFPIIFQRMIWRIQ